MYLNEFKEAIARSKRLGLRGPEFESTNRRFLTLNNLEVLPKVVEEIIGRPNPQEINGKCHAIHVQLAKPLSFFFGTELFFTIGYVSLNSHFMYKKSEQDYIDMIEKGLDSFILDIHTWLTLPSMEILDYTLLTTIGIKNNLKEFMGKVVSKHTDEIDKDFKYYPMLTGEDFLRKIGMGI